MAYNRNRGQGSSLTVAPAEGVQTSATSLVWTLQAAYRLMTLNGQYCLAWSVRKHVFKNQLFKTLELHRTLSSVAFRGLLGTVGDSLDGKRSSVSSGLISCCTELRVELQLIRDTASPCAALIIMCTLRAHIPAINVFYCTRRMGSYYWQHDASQFEPRAIDSKIRIMQIPLLLYMPMHIPVSQRTASTRSWDSADGIPTGYGLDDGGFGVRVPVWSRIFFSPRCPDRFWGPLSLISNGYRSWSGRGVKLNTHPPTSVDVKETWIYTSTPPYAFMA
jgi:hypothetical protein